jgi:hypothetical protein
MRAPTATELANHPTVRQAIEAAWNESLPGDAQRRHEEGGWIYLYLSTGQFLIRRAAAGHQAELNLDDPPEIAGAVVVGVFHTHPNPTAEGWYGGPSEADRGADERDFL